MENAIQHLELFQDIFAQTDQGIFAIDEQGIIILVNRAGEHLFGYNYGELNYQKLECIIPDASEKNVLNFLKSSPKNCATKTLELSGLRKNGKVINLELLQVAVSHGNEKTCILFTTDITGRKNEELLKKDIRNVLNMITQHHPLDRIAKEITEILQKHIDDCKVSIRKLNRKTGTLHNLSSPRLPIDFLQLSEGIKVDSKECYCSAAADSKEEVLISDIKKCSICKDHYELLSKNHIKAAWSFPILSSTNEVLGTLAFYCREHKNPKEFEREVISDLVLLAGMAIEQHSTYIDLKTSKQQLEGYTHKLEGKVQEHTKELMTIVQKLVETNVELEEQILITQKAEHAATTNQELFSAIAKNFPNGIIAVVDSEFKVTYIEGGELDTIGLRDQIYKGLHVDDITAFSTKRKETIKRDVQRTLTGNHLSFETVYKNNTYAVNTTPLINRKNTAENALMVYYNISERKLAEQKILQSLEKEQQLNQLKSSFVSMASHEFRTPLSAILSSATLVEKLNSSEEKKKREKYISKIKSNVRNLTVILNDFLSLSKLEEGKMPLYYEYFDLIPYSKELISEIEPSVKEGQSIILLSDLMSLEVYLDPKLLRHVFLNLLSNAIKYSPSHKEIKVTISSKQKEVSLQIQDCGIGIPPEIQKNIFQRFFRADNARNIQGTGLGLHLVKQYVELMKGTIHFISNISEGTTFFIELPINENNHEKSTINRR